MAGKRYKRRTVYIYKDFQRSFIFSFCLATFGAMLATSIILVIWFKYAVNFDFREVFPYLLAINCIILAVLILLTFVVSLLASHKVGGPLFRIEKGLMAISQGDLTENISLRQDDKLHSFAAKVNATTRSLQQRVGVVKKQAVKVKALAESGQAPPELAKEIDKLNTSFDEMFIL